MTFDEAIEYLGNDWFIALSGQVTVNADKKERFLDAIKMAITALRAQKKAEKNEPLTLDELRDMGGQPYYHVSLQLKNGDGWEILDRLIAKHVEDYNYGKAWLAYRRPPETK